MCLPGIELSEGTFAHNEANLCKRAGAGGGGEGMHRSSAPDPAEESSWLRIKPKGLCDRRAIAQADSRPRFHHPRSGAAP